AELGVECFLIEWRLVVEVKAARRILLVEQVLDPQERAPLVSLVTELQVRDGVRARALVVIGRHVEVEVVLRADIDAGRKAARMSPVGEERSRVLRRMSLLARRRCGTVLRNAARGLRAQQAERAAERQRRRQV